MLRSDGERSLGRLQLGDIDARKRPAEFHADAGVGRQKSLADDAAHRAFAADQNGLDVAAVFVGNEKRRERRSAGKVHDLDIVAGTVEQMVRGRHRQH